MFDFWYVLGYFEIRVLFYSFERKMYSSHVCSHPPTHAHLYLVVHHRRKYQNTTLFGNFTYFWLAWICFVLCVAKNSGFWVGLCIKNTVFSFEDKKVILSTLRGRMLPSPPPKTKPKWGGPGYRTAPSRNFWEQQKQMQRDFFPKKIFHCC